MKFKKGFMRTERLAPVRIFMKPSWTFVLLALFQLLGLCAVVGLFSSTQTQPPKQHNSSHWLVLIVTVKGRLYTQSWVFKAPKNKEFIHNNIFFFFAKQLKTPEVHNLLSLKLKWSVAIIIIAVFETKEFLQKRGGEDLLLSVCPRADRTTGVSCRVPLSRTLSVLGCQVCPGPMWRWWSSARG